MKKKIVLLDTIRKSAHQVLHRGPYEVTLVSADVLNGHMPEALRDAVALGVRSGNAVTDKLIESAPKLLVVGAFGVGTDQVDLTACSKKGISVVHAPYGSTESVAELAFLNMMALARRLCEHNTRMHQGMWEKSTRGAHEVRGKTLGIVGYGNIGEQLAVHAKAFDMQVCYYDVADKPSFGANACDALESLLVRSDFVSVHVDGRFQIISDKEIALMKDGAYLINTSRGKVVNEWAVREAIVSGKLAGAAFDVFEDENPEQPKQSKDNIFSPLQKLPNVILTPHIGASTEEAQETIGQVVAEKMRAFIETGSTGDSVNLPRAIMQRHLQGTRITYFHKNVDGAYDRFINVFGNLRINKDAVSNLDTKGAFGYVMVDISSPPTPTLMQKLESLPEKILIRVIER